MIVSGILKFVFYRTLFGDDHVPYGVFVKPFLPPHMHTFVFAIFPLDTVPGLPKHAFYSEKWGWILLAIIRDREHIEERRACFLIVMVRCKIQHTNEGFPWVPIMCIFFVYDKIDTI